MEAFDDLQEASPGREISHEVPVRSLLVFAGCVVASAAVATALYWGIFGFAHWSTEMTTANKIMLAATPGAPVPAPAARAAAPCPGGQYVCPVHGAVGAPQQPGAKTVVCPTCGTPAQFRSLAPAAATQAAFAGG